MKKLIISLVKVLLSVAIVAWLLWDAFTKDPAAVDTLRTGAKNWWLLSAALLACCGIVALMLLRWYCLVRALGIQCRLRDIFRIGLVGYLFNLAPMGVVGGDLLKAWLLAREQHGHQAESVASIIVDRVIGLYVLLLLGSSAAVLNGLLENPNADVRYVAQAALAVTALGTLGIGVLFAPDVTGGRFIGLLSRLPYVGSPLERLILAVRMYRHKWPVLLAAALMSLCVHSLFTTSIYLIAKGLPGPALSYPLHFAAAPLSACANVIPLPAGPQEGVLKFFYDALAAAPLKGLVVSLTYRILTVLVAAVGMGYYLSSRREVAEVLHEAEEAG